MLAKPKYSRVLPVKKIVDYYAKSDDEAVRMKRALQSLISSINYRNKR